MSLQNLSIKEIEYKLYSKGISSDIIETYFSSIIEQLEEYELQSAKNIIIKKHPEKLFPTVASISCAR